MMVRQMVVQLEITENGVVKYTKDAADLPVNLKRLLQEFVGLSRQCFLMNN